VMKHLKCWMKVKKVKTPLLLFPAKSVVYPEPFGVVLVISPWNYPFQLCLSPLVGAIAAGNKVVVKPSEFAPQTSRALKFVLEEVFTNDEVVVVEGGLPETKILLEQQFDYIFFTGSTPVGKVIMRAAAEHLTPVTLELGGKSPFIIEESADLQLAARRCAWGKFLNSGQTCVAPDFVLIPRKLQDLFIEKLNQEISQFFGDWPLESPDYPRIINQKHYERLLGLYPDATVDPQSRGIAPVILKDSLWTDKVMEDEIFGPLLPVIAYDRLEEALKEILKRPKPLAFYLFSKDQQKIEQILREVPFGGGCVNDVLMHLANPDLPFGGVGASGMGSYHGKKSFDTFTHFKSVVKQSSRFDIPVRYPPYTDGALRIIRKLMN